MQHPILKFLVGLVLALAVIALLAFNGLLLWVATGPRSLNWLSPYIVDAFQTPSHAYSVNIAQTSLIWDGWKHPIDIRLENVTVLTKEGQVFSAFPQISVGIDVLALLEGRIMPTSLTIERPSISLYQNEDRSISFGFSRQEASAPSADATQAVPFAAVLAPLVNPDGQNNLRKLHAVTIADADISVANAHKGVFFKAGNADISFKRNWQGALQASINAKISYGKEQSLINAQFTLPHNGRSIEGNVSFGKLMPGTLAGLFFDNNALSAAQFPLSGKSDVAFDMNGSLQRLHFIIDGEAGMINSDKLESPLAIDLLHAEGQLAHDAGDIQIEHLTARVDGAELSASGSVQLKEKDAAISGSVALSNVPVKDVHAFWPPSVAPESRDWVISNIIDGKVASASARLAIPFGDLAKPDLPQDDIHADIKLENAKIRYLPDHPDVRNVNGVVHVDALALEADIASGEYMKDTRLSGGKVLIEDLNAPNPFIKVNFSAETTARDMVHLLELPRLKHAARLNLHEESAQGTIKGTAALGFYFFAAHDAGTPDMIYDISADVAELSAPAFMQKFDIVHGAGKFTLDTKGLEFKGTGQVNGANATNADIKYVFKSENAFDTFIDITATAPVEALPRFGYPQFPFLKGVLGVKAKLKEGNALELAEATIDLTNATVTLPNFAWLKPDKEQASLELTSEKKQGIVTFPSFHLQGRDMNATGKAELNADLSDFKRVDIDSVKYGNTDLAHVLYEPLPGGWHIEASGNSADLSGWFGGASETSEHSFSFAHFPVVQLKADVGRVVMGKDRSFSNVKADVNCDSQLCSAVNVNGKTQDGKPFAFRILRNPKGMRQLSLHAQSGGAFIHTLGIFDGMADGDLTISGNYDEHGALAGKVDIATYTIHNAPILARILSLASLTGFFDTLRGAGIEFDRLLAPFTLSNDVITLKNAKTHGSAIGMTVDGTITFPKRTLDLKGTVVPSYTLNSVLGKVPLVGSVLTGGEGQGIFAARYSVSGSAQQPDVSVNPLSMLTPGFLRGVFDILDTGSKKESGSDKDE